MSDYWLAVDRFGVIRNAVHTGDGSRIPKPKMDLEDCEWKPREQVSSRGIAQYEMENGL